MTPALWVAVKIASLAGVATFAWRYASSPAARVLGGMVLVGFSLAFPPVVHDLVLGNVMVLYLGAIALVCAYPNRRFAVIPLGILIAIAFKPFIVTVAVWLLIRERRRFVDLVAAAVVATILFALAIGPSVYIEYLVALPKLGGLAQPFSGNLGLSGISQPLALVAIPLSILWAVVAAWRLVPEAGLATAVALGLLVQPTVGFNYAAILIPAAILVWRIHRPAGLVLALVVVFGSAVSPPVAGLIVAVAAAVVGRSRTDPVPAGRRGVTGPTPA